MVVRGRENTWVKIKGVPKWLSPNGMIQNSKFKPTQKKIRQRKEGKNQAVIEKETTRGTRVRKYQIN